MRTSFTLVISGPSGVGKAVVIEELCKFDPLLSVVVSHTTRQARSNDVEGLTYHFTNREMFLDMRNKGGFVEWAEYSENYYGTSVEALRKVLDSGLDAILEIEIEGAKQVRKNAYPHHSLFILPPSFASLSRRLYERKTDTPEAIEKRLKKAPEEIREARNFDYFVVNEDDKFQQCVMLVRGLIECLRTGIKPNALVFRDMQRLQEVEATID